MLEIIMYLFETYIHTAPKTRVDVDQDKLTEDLTRVGFKRGDIYNAFNWLETLAMMQESMVSSFSESDPLAIRIYTCEEMAHLDSASRGFLLYLEQVHLLTPQVREMVIERVMALESNHLVLADLKWIVLMVLFNIPGHESAYQQMEALLFDIHDDELH